MTTMPPGLASRPPNAPGVVTPMMVSNVIQLVNEGDTDFNMKYGPLDRLILPAGASVFVSEEIGWHFLGKWWTTNDNPRDPERRADYQRLRALYGAYEDEVIWQENYPRLVAYSATGERITSLIDDPDGIQSSGTRTPLGQQKSLESQVQILQAQLLELTARLDRERANRPETPDVPADTPNAPAPKPTIPSIPTPRVQNVGGQVPVPVAPPAVEPLNPEEAQFAVGTPVVAQVGLAYVPPDLAAAPGPDELPEAPVDEPSRVPTTARRADQ